MVPDAHWREYRIPWWGELALAFGSTLVPFSVGLVAAFALVFAIGMPGEEGLLASPLLAAGVAPDRIREIVRGVDQLSRMSAGLLMGIAALAGIGLVIARTVADRATARGLVAAADAGAPRHLVPSPQQLERVARPGSTLLETTLLVVGWSVAGLSALVLFVALTEGFEDALVVGLSGFVLAALLLGGRALERRRGRPLRERLRARLAEHWRPGDEAAAWRTAYERGETHGRGDGGDGRSAFTRVGGAFGRAGVAALVGVPLLMYVFIRLRYPDAVRVSPSRWDLGDPVEVTGQAQELLTAVIWGFSAILLTSVVLPAIGALLVARGTAAEATRLRRDLADPRAPRPPQRVLQHHAERRAAPLAQLFAAIAGVGLSFGPAALILSTMDTYEFPHADAFFAPYRPIAVLCILSAAVLLGAALFLNSLAAEHGRELRNGIMQRWPTLPEVPVGDDGSEASARRGPVLSE